GVDNNINNNMMFGIGYSLNNSDIKAYKDIIDSNGHNFYFYSKYKIDQLYFQGLLNFGFAKYDREIINNFSSENIKSSHNVYNYGFALKTGYEMPNGLTPEIGLRYIYISQNSYKDSMNRKISTDGNGSLTWVSGIKYKYNFDTISLKTKLNFTYDIINDDDVINTDYYGYKSQIIGESLNPFGIESGLALETSFDKFNVSLEYDFNFRENFQNHTGIIKAKYNF
ncbi:MAG: autotransporter outer membrane beta-barrel domain-containing protein, partial [Alphaproteobacteria bacterium]